MKIVNYISTISIPIIFFIVLIIGLKEKVKVFDIFIEGVKEGTKIVIQLFPTILAIFIAVGMLRSSGIMDIITIITKEINIPSELTPLVLLRPVSGSASMAIATDIMKTYGVDSLLGKMASVIMGSTETTLYVIAIYTSSLKIKKTRTVLACALIADIIGITTAIIICNLFYL